MKASEVKIADLTSSKACAETIRRIEMNPGNVVGGKKAFFSGRATFLTVAAKKKVEAIERKMAAFADAAEEGDE
ncbi:hypothetical protein ACU4GI_32920 [Cupriavidus basilensis]